MSPSPKQARDLTDADKAIANHLAIRISKLRRVSNPTIRKALLALNRTDINRLIGTTGLTRGGVLDLAETFMLSGGAK